ncbi:WD40 repeat domain-containing protein [Planktothrix agardhii 1806]|uniref:WD40 repeat domain-containing protein n=1 Tax=Planktothrix agardhii TaxID=1160 RepID=UPI001F25213B|nr:WD40 repeat domain-containing protein [Planktothrix agardhii]MCF3572170.1 WD40 repeat domain-containing protein [Planktothrix agardhii 1805]MCF3584939.1 WD40 repeat domain-containing protein [Planktothrix agardhii 1803]MCF3601621.1 WD40 repeat domain-containing protein [Planktothrix agardhii 1804]MCF3617470.1 WD40 repeat domain-containing protein [Planktothrix agardhii 1806]
MMDNLKSWCFLVSRNQYLDYRTVVAPNFICEAGIGNILAKVTEGDITEQGTAFYREIMYSKAADFTIIYRIIEATAENTGIDGNGCLKDSVGREISLIEGLVFQGLLKDKDIVVTEQNLEAAHQQVISYYREFWEAITRISIFPSESIEYREPSGQSLNLIKLTAYIAGEKQQLSLPQKERLELNYSSWKIIDKNIDKKTYNKEEVASLAVFPDSETFAARYNCDIVVWKISEKEPIHEFSVTEKQLGGFPTPIVVNSTGELIATARIEGFDENKIKLYNLNTNGCKDLGTQGQFNPTRVKAVVFSPDSKIVFSAGGKKIKLWDAECEGIERGELSGHSDDVSCLGVDSNDGLLASGDRRGYIKLWKILNKKVIFTTPSDKFPINSLAFSPDGQFLVSGSDGGAIKVWNIKTQKEHPVDWKQSQPINCVAFSPNGSLIATGCDNTIIQIWDLKNPQSSPICTLEEHDKAVTAVVFTPDGKKLISGSKDGTVRVWRPVQK